MARPAGFFDVEERLAGVLRKGDDLERLGAVIDFERFRPELERAVPRADRSKGGRPAFDHVLMFKVLILQTQNNLSDERTEFYLRDRLTWMRFLGRRHVPPKRSRPTDRYAVGATEHGHGRSSRSIPDLKQWPYLASLDRILHGAPRDARDVQLAPQHAEQDLR